MAFDVTRIPRAALVWLFCLVLCCLAGLIAFIHFDVAIARLVYPLLRQWVGVLAAGLGSAILLGLEAAAFVCLGLARIIRGHISPFGKAVALACVSSLCAYAVNSSVLKIAFGVVPPSDVLEGAPHAFHFLQGSFNSSFPSGHMVLAGAFAGVFMRLYPRTVWLLSALMLCAAVLLVLGDWHFVSDVIAGSFLGLSAGLLAGELWLTHIMSDRKNP
jgi:membrane-associated phospholipid phosphatase